MTKPKKTESSWPWIIQVPAILLAGAWNWFVSLFKSEDES